MDKYTIHDIQQILKWNEWTNNNTFGCSYGAYDDNCFLFKCVMVPRKFMLFYNNDTHDLQVMCIDMVNLKYHQYIVKLGKWVVENNMVCFTNIDRCIIIRVAYGSYDVELKIAIEYGSFDGIISVENCNFIHDVNLAKKHIIYCKHFLETCGITLQTIAGYHKLNEQMDELLSREIQNDINDMFGNISNEDAWKAIDEVVDELGIN